MFSTFRRFPSSLLIHSTRGFTTSSSSSRAMRHIINYKGSYAMCAGAAAVAFSTSSARVHAEEVKNANTSSTPAPPPISSLPRRYANLSDFLANVDVVLYQYETCPFCNKVRAFLDASAIPYRVVEVHPFRKTELQWTDYKKVPVLTIDGVEVRDSSSIVSFLHDVLNSYRGAKQHYITHEEQAARQWVDTALLKYTAPNLYLTWADSVESSAYISQHSQFSGVNQLFTKYSGALAMHLITKKLIKKYNMQDPRAELFALCRDWSSRLSSRDFHGGSSFDTADVVAFGVLRAMRPYHVGKLIMDENNTGKEFVAWYNRMENCVKSAQKR